MEQIGELILDQSLHGYKDGHTLLASSSDLLPLEKRTLLSMSDSSGTFQDKKFSEYITGYPLPENRFYALSKTWNAPEMPRPGCVWTHTILISIEDLKKIRNLHALTKHFQRPIKEQFSDYSMSIEYFSDKIEEPSPVIFDEYADISVCLYGNPDKSIVLFSNTSETLELELFAIWDNQWPTLKQCFSFCTGSPSLKAFGSKSLDIQVLPLKQERTIDREESSSYLKFEENSKNRRKDRWVKVFDFDRHKKFGSFLNLYGNDIRGAKSRFVPLADCFLCIQKGIDDVSFVESLKIIDKGFKDIGEAEDLRNWIFKKAINENLIQPYTIIQALLDSKRFLESNVEWTFLKSVLVNSIKKNLLTKKQLTPLLTNLIKSDRKKVNEIICDIPFFLWFDLDFVDEKAIEYYLNVESNEVIFPDLFSANETVQLKWVQHLLKSSNLDWIQFIKYTLENGKSLWYSDIISKSGIDGFAAVLDWVFVSNKELPSLFDEWIYDNYLDFFSYYGKRNSFNSASIMLLLSIFSPTEEKIRNVEGDIWIKILHGDVTTKDKTWNVGLLTFIMNGALMSSLQESEQISSLGFLKLHNYFSNSLVEETTWKRFQYTLGSELYYLSERGTLRSLIKSTYDIVPEWDKCEFLRRSYVCAFINHKWDAPIFLNSITDMPVLVKVMEFLKMVKPGKNLLQAIKSIIEEDEKFKHLKGIV